MVDTTLEFSRQALHFAEEAASLLKHVQAVHDELEDVDLEPKPCPWCPGVAPVGSVLCMKCEAEAERRKRA
jgi:hypothetical protein